MSRECTRGVCVNEGGQVGGVRKEGRGGSAISRFPDVPVPRFPVRVLSPPPNHPCALPGACPGSWVTPFAPTPTSSPTCPFIPIRLNTLLNHKRLRREHDMSTGVGHGGGEGGVEGRDVGGGRGGGHSGGVGGGFIRVKEGEGGRGERFFLLCDHGWGGGLGVGLSSRYDTGRLGVVWTDNNQGRRVHPTVDAPEERPAPTPASKSHRSQKLNRRGSGNFPVYSYWG